LAQKITSEIYFDKAQNGARVLFDLENYGVRLLDGVKDDDESYFLRNFNDDTIYELTLKESYDLLALYSCNDVSKTVLLKQIVEIMRK
jgi:hypothetical protein